MILGDPNPPSNFRLPAGAWVVAISKVPDARRQGVTSEAYKSYSAGRNDRSQRSRWYLDGGQGLWNNDLLNV